MEVLVAMILAVVVTLVTIFLIKGSFAKESVPALPIVGGLYTSEEYLSNPFFDTDFRILKVLQVSDGWVEYQRLRSDCSETISIDSIKVKYFMEFFVPYVSKDASSET